MEHLGSKEHFSKSSDGTRKVVREAIRRTRGGSGVTKMLILECGHEVRSSGNPRTVWCSRCMTTVPHVRVAAVLAARALVNVGCEAEARKISRCPVNKRNGFSCLFKAVDQVGVSIRVRWGAAAMKPDSLYVFALEALSLLRSAMYVVVRHDPLSEAWLDLLVDRIRVVSGVDPQQFKHLLEDEKW